MVQFLTRIPIRATLDVNSEDFGKGLALAPAVGLVIGGLLYGAYLLSSMIFSTVAVSVILVVFYVILTGGVHIDGLGDTFDGIFSGRPKERVMEIMKDSRSGTNAVLVIVLTLLLDIVLIEHLIDKGLPLTLVLFPVVGRLSCVTGAGTFKYAREEGLGKSFVNYCGPKEIIIGAFITLAVSIITYNYQLIIAVLTTFLAVYLINLYFSKKIDGITGDILGASCELSQTAFLFITAIVISIF